MRAVNQSLPDDQQLRILLGNPPIDWSPVKTAADVQPFQAQHGTPYAQIVTDEVLDKGLKALIIIGGSHLGCGMVTNTMQFPGGEQTDQVQPLPGSDGGAPAAQPQMRQLPQGGAPDGQSQMRQLPQAAGGKACLMQQIVDAEYPGRTFGILVHTGFADDLCSAQAEERMASWQAPALALVQGSWLETIDCQKFPRMVLMRRSGSSAGNAPASSTRPDEQPPAPAQAQMRCYPIDPLIYLDQDYVAGMSRRREILTGEPLRWQDVSESNPHRFVDKSAR